MNIFFLIKKYKRKLKMQQQNNFVIEKNDKNIKQIQLPIFQ